jgi:hypothetical protein
MHKNSKSTKSKGLSRFNVFGPPPLLYGEDEAAYNEMLARVSGALGPRDFIEEIWVHDLVDAAWSMSRLRRILAAYLGDKVRDDVNQEASSLAKANPKLMEGTDKEKEEMTKLLDPDSELSWDEQTEQFPHAYKKFEKFWDSAETTLDKDLIQAKVLIHNFHTVEKIERLIATSQRRLDGVIREFDRHRFVKDHRDSVQNVVDAEFNSINQTAPAPKITKVA